MWAQIFSWTQIRIIIDFGDSGENLLHRVLILGIALLLLSIVLHEWLYPALYEIRARLNKCGRPRWQFWHPLGISGLKWVLDGLKYHQFPQNRLRDYEVLGDTFFRQDILDFGLHTRDPENLKTILATKFGDFSIKSRSDALEPVFGLGIFTMDGAGWKHSREMLRPQFAREQISRLCLIRRHTKELIKSIVSYGNNTVDAQALLLQFTMDTATEFLLGESVNSLPASQHNQLRAIADDNTIITAEEFVQSFQFLRRNALLRVSYGILGRFQNTSKFRRHRRRANSFIDYFVHRALRSVTEKRHGFTEATSGEAEYVFAEELAKATSDPKVIRGQLFNILIAGRDTSASTLGFAIYYLARHPDAYQRLRQECLMNDPQTFEQLKRASFLNAVINETLRLAPIVAINQRMAVRDTILPRGGGKFEDQPIFVPKGTNVGYSTHALQRNPKYWPDPHKFKPERWADTRPKPWTFIPFSGGPRICLGQQFALTEMALTLSTLCQHFSSLQPGTDEQYPMLDLELTLQCANGVLVKFIE